MLPLVTASEMKEIDRKAAEVFGTPTHDLMENAGKGLSKVIFKQYPETRKIAIFCGKGNNGGDGLVAARYLSGKANVVVFLLCAKEEMRGDAGANLDKYKGKLFEITSEEEFKKTISGASKADIIVDAILGTGLKAELTGQYRSVVEGINSLGKKIVSVDIPSGISSDTGQVMGVAVKAELTITFGIPKVGLYLFPGSEYAGKIEVIDIGFPEALISGEGIRAGTIERTDIAPLFPPRLKDTHKGNYGHLLVVAGSRGKTGAAAMTASSALRTGAGIVTLAVPKNLQPIYEMKLIEVMTEPLSEGERWSIGENALGEVLSLAEDKSAVAIGPGIVPTPAATMVMAKLIKELYQPIVIDAGGIDAIIGNPDVLKEAKGPRVITPHPGEMGRLLGVSSRDVHADRVGIASRVAVENNVCVVLKGAHTVIALPEGRVYINTTGNPGMATAGAGDVLTGMIGGLLAQGFKPELAAIAAVYLHGLTGDLLSNEKGDYGIIATDLIEKIPYAINSVRRET
ncbi:MAG: NAD(P)H-hydrate dehydratase [Deltaproteobacteria bacterium]